MLSSCVTCAKRHQLLLVLHSLIIFHMSTAHIRYCCLILSLFQSPLPFYSLLFHIAPPSISAQLPQAVATHRQHDPSDSLPFRNPRPAAPSLTTIVTACRQNSNHFSFPPIRTNSTSRVLSNLIPRFFPHSQRERPPRTRPRNQTSDHRRREYHQQHIATD